MAASAAFARTHARPALASVTRLGAVRCASFYDRRFVAQALEPLPRISLQTLVAFDKRYSDGEQKLLVSADHVRRQLPTRLARRILDMNNLPYICGINPHIQYVYDTYVESFERVLALPRIGTLEQEAAFCSTLRDVLDRARAVLPRMARASKEISVYMDSRQLNTFIDNFLVRCVPGNRYTAGQRRGGGMLLVARRKATRKQADRTTRDKQGVKAAVAPLDSLGQCPLPTCFASHRPQPH